MTENIPTPKPRQPGRRTFEEATALVESWRTSGLTKEAFCRQHGVKRSNLTSCLLRMAKRESRTRLAAGFIEVRPRSTLTGTALTLEIDGAGRVVGLDVPTAIALISALRTQPQ